jgi:hypothetical protein
LTAWLRLLATHWPEQQTALERLARLDEQQRYARLSDPQLQPQMLSLIEQLLTALQARS